MVEHLIVHLPVDDFLKGCEGLVKAFQIVGGKEHGICAAKHPLVRRFIRPCRGIIRLRGLFWPRTDAFSQANIVPWPAGGVGDEVAKTLDKIGTEPYIGFESYNEAFWAGRGGGHSGGKVHTQADFAAGQVPRLEGEARRSAG